MTSVQKVSDLPRLPSHPSTLLKLACDDMDQVFTNPRFRVAVHSDFCSPDEDGSSCAVCVAGATLINRIGHDPEVFEGGHFGSVSCYSDRVALKALDVVRRGGIRVKMYVELLLGRSLTPGEATALLAAEAVVVPDLPTWPKTRFTALAFRRAMRRIATELEKAGF